MTSYARILLVTYALGMAFSAGILGGAYLIVWWLA